MANYNNLQAAIQATIKANGAQEITGPVLQSQLLAMISSLGLGYQYVGMADPTTDPGTPDQRVFYLATTEGVYSNFGDLQLAADEIAFLVWNVTWRKEVLATGIGEQTLQAISDCLQSLQSQVDSVASRLDAADDFAALVNANNELFSEVQQSLQAQLDSLAARDNYDELTASAFFADMAGISTLYVDGMVVGGYTIDGAQLDEAIRLAHTAYQKPSTGIPNTDIQFPYITIGTTQIYLGSTAMSLAGLTSVTAQKFYLTADLYFEVVNGNVHLHTPSDKGFYVDGFASAGGLSDTPGSSGIDLTAMWENLQVNESGTEGYNLLIAAAHIPDVATQYGYVKTSAISDMATRTWVSSQGFLTPTDGDTLSEALQSLQAQIDSVASRENTDELLSSILCGYFDADGNANSALRLATVNKTAWGQTYWTANGVPDNVSGNMTGVGSITATGLIKTTNYVQAARFYLTDSIYFLVDSYGVKLEGAGFYTDSFVSAGGFSSGGSTPGIDLTAMWENLQVNDPDTEGYNLLIAAAHIPDTATIYGYVKTSAISDMATRTWVTSQGYLTSASLAGYATVDRLDADELTLAACLQSLQAQVDSVASRDMFDELKATALFGDIITATAIYGAFTGDLSGNATTASYLVGTSYGVGSGTNPVYFSGGRPAASAATVGSAAVPVYLSGGVITACAGSSLFEDLGSTASLNLYAIIAGRTRIIYDLYATYDAAGEDIADNFTIVSKTIQSLQGQIDSVASRNAFGELVASYLAADTVSAASFYGALNGNATTASYLVGTGYGVGSATVPVYFSGGLPVAVTASALFSGLSSSAGTNLSITIAGQNRTATLYATYDNAGENIATCFDTVSTALKSLQSQVDSVATRNAFNELLATTFYGDMVSVGKDLNVTGNIFALGAVTAGASSASSDRRLKSGLMPVSGEKALAVLMRLRPTEWTWNGNSTLEGKRSAGLVAQDVEGVLPFAVSGSDYLALNYNVFHAYEIAGLQNHESRIIRLEQKVFQ